MKWFSQLRHHGQSSAFLATAILRRRDLRRSVMFWGTLIAIGMAFLGAFVLMDALAETPIVFVLYWLLVVFLVVFQLLLALYDMLMVSREMREEAKDELRESMESLSKPESDEDSSP